jgi:hypothetical protein
MSGRRTDPVAPPAPPTPATGLSLLLPRADALTAALVAPPSTAPVSRADLERIRGALLRDLPPLVDELPRGERLRLDAFRFAQTRERPESLSVSEPAFVPSPSRCRRAVGLAAVERCVRRRSPAPASAVAEVLAAAVDDVAAAGDARPPWWAPWYAGLAPGARTVVEADAVTWATQLWTALSWESLPQPPVIGGRDDWWDCPQARRLTLRGQADVRVFVDGRPVLLVVGSGVPPSRWRVALGFPALVGALARGERSIPTRVVGSWPASGQVRILEVGAEVLDECATAVVSATATWVDARLEAAGARVA